MITSLETANREKLLQKAKELGELAEKHAAQADLDARLPDEVYEILAPPILFQPRECQ